jgi:acyl-CoA thioesterase-1
MKAPGVSFWLAVLGCLLLPLTVAAVENRAEVRILVLGDSLSAGYGLSAAEAFPAQLEQALRQSGQEVRVINAGVSGDTTAGGLARLEWALAERPQLVIVQLGANDALRGLDPEQARANLDAILTRLQKEGTQVLLAGMRAPRNLGPAYYIKFDLIYSDLARKHRVALDPFFLEGVALRPELNQPDGLHPNARGVAVIVRRLLPQVQTLLTSRP